MERLTKLATIHNGNKYVSALGSGKGAWPRIIQRLAEYENTGLEPEEIMGPSQAVPQTLEKMINSEIDYIDYEIDNLKQYLAQNVERFKAYIAGGDAYQIVSTFRSSLYQSIQGDCARIDAYREKKRYLVTLIKKLKEETT